MQLILLGQAIIGGMVLLPCLFGIAFFMMQIILLLIGAAARGMGLIHKSQEELKKVSMKISLFFAAAICAVVIWNAST
jgi:hypothetical protein